MRIYNSFTVLSLKEAAQKYGVPEHYFRRLYKEQEMSGKPAMPNGAFLRGVKFPSDKRLYLFEDDLEILAQPEAFFLPRVYSQEAIDGKIDISIGDEIDRVISEEDRSEQ